MSYSTDEGRVKALLSFIQEYPEPNRSLPLNVKTIIDYISELLNDLQSEFLISVDDDNIIESIDQNSIIIDVVNSLAGNEDGNVPRDVQSNILFSISYLLDKIFDKPIGQYISIQDDTTIYDLSRLIIEAHYDYFEE